MKIKLRVRRACVSAFLLLAGGCQFLQNEFSTLNVAPPSVRALQEPTPSPW